MKLSRRKIIKLFGLSTAAIAFSPFVGCEKALDEVISSANNSQTEEDAFNLVRQFCDSNLIGNTNKATLNKINGIFESAQDFVPIANNYKILSSKSESNYVKVYVEYDYVGVHKGNDFYFMTSKNNNSKIIAKYIVKNGVIVNGNAPFLQTDIYKDYIRRSLTLNKDSILRYNNNAFMKEHFVQKEVKYNHILSLLG